MTWTPDDIEPRLQELATLQENWNSYGAEPIDPASLLTVRTVLGFLTTADVPKPQLFPRIDGSVQLEWLGISGEIECAGTKITAWLSMLTDANDAGVEIQGDVSNAAMIVRMWVAGVKP